MPDKQHYQAEKPTLYKKHHGKRRAAKPSKKSVYR